MLLDEINDFIEDFVAFCELEDVDLPYKQPDIAVDVVLDLRVLVRFDRDFAQLWCKGLVQFCILREPKHAAHDIREVDDVCHEAAHDVRTKVPTMSAYSRDSRV